MTGIIQLLPHAVANQIAAGEVIQRPASVVKELVENAVDAGATEIVILIKEGGRTLIQVNDNGKGMSEEDAEICFERHATSKIKNADDLFKLSTMGFRGEALASIASIAEVELKTKKSDDEVGTLIRMKGSDLEKKDAIAISEGTQILVKNLFFNVPARRKFLKADATEFRHIVTEIQRVALTQESVRFTLFHNDGEVLQLPKTQLKQRIVHLFGKNMNNHLLNIKTETELGVIKGFVGTPELAKKKYGDQYFFVNGRFMKHPYFHRAVSDAFDQLIASDAVPAYFIYFEVPPQNIDVNIHPTKTEIKFEDESTWWKLIKACVREGLGRVNMEPSIDFETGGIIDLPKGHMDTPVREPQTIVDPNYNPFKSSSSSGGYKSSYSKSNEVVQDWEKLYQNMKSDIDEETLPEQQVAFDEPSLEVGKFIQLKNKYICTAVKSGMMIIDQKRAHERILFEQFMENIDQKKQVSQKHLYPEQIDLSTEDYLILEDIMGDLNALGFEIREFGQNAVIVDGLPSEIAEKSASAILGELIGAYRLNQQNVQSDVKKKIAFSLACASSIDSNAKLSVEEMRGIFDQLFACTEHKYTPDGKPIVNIFALEEIDKLF